MCLQRREDLRGTSWGQKGKMCSRWAELVKKLEKDFGFVQSPLAPDVRDV